MKEKGITIKGTGSVGPTSTCPKCGVTFGKNYFEQTHEQECTGKLKNFVVLYHDTHNGATPPQGFQCWAEDGEHAEEQCVNAYPECDVVWVWQGPFGVGIEPALVDYYNVGE